MLRVTRPGAIELRRNPQRRRQKPSSRWPMGPARPEHQPHPGLAPAAGPSDWPHHRFDAGGRSAHAWPRQRQAYRAPHALVGRASGKLPTPYPAHPRTLTARYLRPTGRHSAPPLPNPSRDGTAWQADPEPTTGTLTILAAFGEKEENPPYCAHV